MYIHTKNGPYLTTFAQEKGRLCRYTTIKKTLPVIYLSEALLKEIAQNLQHDCSYYNLFVKRRTIDPKIKYDEKNFQWKPHTQHWDAKKDQRIRNNHFLLIAEPQVHLFLSPI